MAAARAYLDTALGQTIGDWCRTMPGAEAHLIACLGTFSQPPESLDINPATNHKVFLDMQLNLLANDPRCLGLYGVMTYLSSYTDEETVRWMGRLFRHYCIEGKSRPYCDDPYVLPHLRNPDFEDGTSGWTVSAAEPGPPAGSTLLVADVLRRLAGSFSQAEAGHFDQIERRRRAAGKVVPARFCQLL